MKPLYLALLFALSFFNMSYAQLSGSMVEGRVVDENQDPISFASVVLFNSSDSTMVKAGYSEDNGSFRFTPAPGTYYINISFVGYDTYNSQNFTVSENNSTTLDVIKMSPFATELGEVVVAATKPLVEVKPDKTVFNVEGSVNAIGNNGLELLRKAPGVVVDNNERIMLSGKTGVKVYIDGRQSILTGDDLSSYLKSLQSTQIEAIEIITQPSAKYEADGNAGIINIRLIKDKSLGTNATGSLGYNQATHARYDANLNVNSRTKNINVFGNFNYANGENTEFNTFIRTTPDIYAYQTTSNLNGWDNKSLRGGFDITSGKNSTIGFLFDGYMNDESFNGNVTTEIAPDPSTPITQILKGSNTVDNSRNNYNFNGNYRFDNTKGNVLNVDLDYGNYTSEGNSYQPNYYYDPNTGELTDTRIFSSNTPTTIDIKTLKLDYEKPLWGGTLGAGFKIALINTDNTYNFYNIIDNNPVLDTDRSNQFTYDENVNAGYLSYGRQWKKIAFQAGVRVEQTDSKGVLTSYNEQNKETVDQEYVDVFPSAGITYQLNQKNSFRLNYSRRIDRPNYQDLNPFEFKLDEITFQKGNPFLRPQYSNSVSLTHTYNYTLNTSFTYSRTDDLMAQLTDTASMGSAFITTANVANQDVYAFNVSYPFNVSRIWNVFANTGVNYTHNKGDFGDGKTVDISATTFNIYAQNTFTLPKNFQIELSGWYNSPGIWGGNFATKQIWSIDAGIQKKIFKERGTLKLGVADIFNSQHWSGENNFGGLHLIAMGGWESRQFKANFTYLMGNSQVKGSRDRNTGLEDETKRIKAK
jgi:iron complex outermembrane recepter protein